MGVFVRILIRYIAGFLVLRGLLSQDDALLIAGDPDLAALVEAGIGVAAATAVESWYLVARKLGWQT